jgi:hypothetical protein
MARKEETRKKEVGRKEAARREAARREDRADIDLLREMVLQREDPFGEMDITPDSAADDGKIFGLNAVERMFLSIGLFLVITVLSIFLLLMTDSIAIP